MYVVSYGIRFGHQQQRESELNQKKYISRNVDTKDIYLLARSSSRIFFFLKKKKGERSQRLLDLGFLCM